MRSPSVTSATAQKKSFVNLNRQIWRGWDSSEFLRMAGTHGTRRYKWILLPYLKTPFPRWTVREISRGRSIYSTLASLCYSTGAKKEPKAKRKPQKPKQNGSKSELQKKQKGTILNSSSIVWMRVRLWNCTKK